MKSKTLGFTLLLTSAIFLSCAGHSKQKAAPKGEAGRLTAIINEYTESEKRLDPYAATFFNIEENLSKFGDYPAPTFFERAWAIPTTALQKLKAIRTAELSPEYLRTYKIFSYNIQTEVDGIQFPSRYLDFNQMGNRLHSFMDETSKDLTSFPFNSVAHYEDFVKRSEGFPTYVDNQIAVLKEGMSKKIVLSCVTANAALSTYQDALETNVEKNPFFRPIGFMPKEFSEDDRKRLNSEFHSMVKDRIIPGYAKFDHFFRTEYLPHCRSQYGMGNLPNGKAWYNHAILASTSLPLTAEEIHARGLKEVERIKTEMIELQNELGMKGSFREFEKSLLNDPKYFFTNEKDIFDAFYKVKAETAKKIPQFFSLIPTHDYKIVASSNPEDAAGSYNQPTEMLPYGRFVVSTKNHRAVPKYQVTTLLLHETIPGHHFQLALQFELKDQLSEYQRKLSDCNAFVEGWALYSEHLGYEMGMYTDPVQKLGNLNDEMLRAVRLVVDTGIHAYGWSRKKTIAYMTENLASDTKAISNEANRYSVWPGQALGYKIGQMKILELRKYAEDTLGSRFDIKAFHKVVIGSGTVTLPILEAQVKDWVASVQARG